MQKFRKIVVGISGGVDSAVSALLLKKIGFNITGVFMRNWDIPDETGCCSANEDLDYALKVCNKLNIELIQVDFVKEYWNYVFSYLLNEYENGYTPNPDILCNKHIKFDHFYKYATEKLNADAIATGHYALTSFGRFLENFQPNKNVQLLQAVDSLKDQTFFLSQIQNNALQRTMFPIGNLLKSQVREIAKENDLDFVATKSESTGICFIGKRSFSKFISEYLPDKVGPFIDVETGIHVGDHKGLHHWTLGQRANLGGFRKPYIIAKKDVQSNTIFVVSGTNHPFLYTEIFYTEPPHWIDSSQTFLTNQAVLNCSFRFQHTKPLIPCQIFTMKNDLNVVKLSVPTRAITPGQYAVFYWENQCLGSARIVHTGPNCYYLNKNFIDKNDLLENVNKR